ncbi:MAG: molybdopterin-dependent oxidoreductase [Myxococcales bacterium]|nr:molybdopterin-dependent oxidoreductase [Myxococcales bacterium]
MSQGPDAIRTFCRICEAHCGLVADVQEGRVVRVRPDRSHPVSQGYVCVKGTSAGEVHHDPERINYPMKRTPDGWQRIGWEQALAEIGAKVRALRRKHGKRCTALYTGNPTFFNAGATLWSTAFLEALGSPNHFASHSVDVNNKFHVATEMYGSSLVQPVPDFDHCRYLVCLGTNPMVSQMSVVHLPHALRTLQRIQERGGSVVIVDPRRTETAQRVGEHLPIRPGTDAVLLLGMLHTLSQESLDLQRVRTVAEGVDAFLAAAEPWPAERAASITGIEADRIRKLALDLLHAEGGALYMSTGVNMGPFGSLAYWLLQGLNLITGQLDRRGGLLVPPGAYPALSLARAVGLGGFDRHRTQADGWHRVAGAFPLGALADEIRVDRPDRIRALFVCAGNPVRSAPGDLAGALEELDLLVGIDLYVNDTTVKADYVLPATDMLERSDFALAHTLLQVHPHAQFTDPVVPPHKQRRAEWEIFRDLAKACGASLLSPSLCGLPAHLPITVDTVVAALLRWGGHTSLKALRQTPEGVMLPPTEPGSFLGKRVPRGRVQLAPEALVADLERLEASIHELTAPGLRLVGRRRRHRHNSWLPRRAEAPPTLLIHPEDAVARGIAMGDRVQVTAGDRQIEAVAELSEEVQPTVVVMPHGHEPPYDVNRLLPLTMEPVSGQMVFHAHTVNVAPSG